MGLSCEELVERAWEALDEEDFDEAEAFSRRALMVDPSSVDARIGLARALTSKDQYDAALGLLREASKLAPEDAEVRIELGIALFEHCEFQESEKNLRLAMELGVESPDVYYWTALVLERRGDYPTADEYFAKAHELDTVGYPLPKRMTRREFVSAVEEARGRLPAEFDKHLENVAIRVEDLPDEKILTDSNPPIDPCILGLFVGVPLPDKLATGQAPHLPDSIFLFKRNLERSSEDWDDLVDDIHTTLYHEIGHYIGFDEDDLESRGFA